MRAGYLRGALSPQATQRQMDVLAAYVAAGGSVQAAADLVGIRPGTVKRHLADLRARSGLTTEQLIYRGRAERWLVVPSLEPNCESAGTPGAVPCRTTPPILRHQNDQGPRFSAAASTKPARSPRSQDPHQRPTLPSVG